MNTWSLSLGLALICGYTCSVCSGEWCHDHTQCVNGKCCGGYCFWHTNSNCPCSKDTDCSSGEECFIPGLFCRPTQLPKFTFHSRIDATSTKKPYTTPTANNNNNNNCVWDSDCKGSAVCQEEKCVYDHRSTNTETTRKGNRSVVITIIVFGVVATVISILYFLREKTRKRPVLLPQSNRTGITREAAMTIGTTHHGLETTQLTTRAACNGAAIDVEAVSSTMRPNAPPSYSSLEFERQGNENDENKEPPSYDEAVRTSRVVP